MSSDKPTVSIGMPVFNGANYVKEAVESILTQTYSDFELIISDNASTDATGEICQAYIKQDSRIRYCLNKKKLGAAVNFNRVFKLARGKYFKWAAHDDVIAPDFLEKCIAVLEQDSSLVLSYPKARIIDENGKPIQNYDLQLNTNSPNPSERFGDLLRGHQCFEIFGLIPVSALKSTPLIGNYGHGDGVLLARLALQGRFHEIPEYLFFPRRHPEQSMNTFGAHNQVFPDYHSYTVWFDAEKEGQIIYPFWTILNEYNKSVLQTSLSWNERVNCCWVICKWAFRMRGFLKLDLLIAAKQIWRRFTRNDKKTQIAGRASI